MNLRCTYVYAPDGIWKTMPDDPWGARSWIPVTKKSESKRNSTFSSSRVMQPVSTQTRQYKWHVIYLRFTCSFPQQTGASTLKTWTILQKMNQPCQVTDTGKNNITRTTGAFASSRKWNEVGCDSATQKLVATPLPKSQNNCTIINSFLLSSGIIDKVQSC